MSHSEKLYKEAYELHYKRDDLEAAREKYEQLIATYPASKEARYAESQIDNLSRDALRVKESGYDLWDKALAHLVSGEDDASVDLLDKLQASNLRADRYALVQKLLGIINYLHQPLHKRLREEFRCGHCGSTACQIDEGQLTGPAAYRGGHDVLVLALTCERCGTMAFFNKHVLGEGRTAGLDIADIEGLRRAWNSGL